MFHLFFLVLFMTYCANCGEKLPENASFCPKCGIRTQIGVGAGAAEPREAIRQAFFEAGKELERAFSMAAEEVRKAFAEAKEDIEKTRKTPKETITCAQCGSSNPAEAKFCSTCGKPLSKTA